MPATIVDELLASPAAAALATAGWRVVHAAAHSAGVADLAAERRWASGSSIARVRLIIHSDAESDRLLFPAVDDKAFDPLPFYSIGDDEPAQHRALALLAGPELVEQLHARAYPRDAARMRRARIDALPARTRAGAISTSAIDDAFRAIESIRRDLLAHDLEVLRDDLDLDRDAAAAALLDAAARCDLLYPIVIARAELWTLPDRKRHRWLRAERCAIVGHERQWVDVVDAEAFGSYAQALTRHITAALRKRRFAPADASSRS